MKTATSQTPRSLLLFNAYHLLADYRSRLSWSRFIEKVCEVTAVIGMGGLTYLLITHFLFQSLTVSGSSMYPTLFDNGNYWLNRSYYYRHDPQRTDIVALKDPVDGILVVKRIIAMPGESIYLNRGKVYVNGKLLNEPYISKYMPTFAYERNESEFLIIGKDSYFVLGDNRGNSMDSRTYGPVPRANILGKLIE
jgi:signal peptidase I